MATAATYLAPLRGLLACGSDQTECGRRLPNLLGPGPPRARAGDSLQAGLPDGWPTSSAAIAAGGIGEKQPAGWGEAACGAAGGRAEAASRVAGWMWESGLRGSRRDSQDFGGVAGWMGGSGQWWGWWDGDEGG